MTDTATRTSEDEHSDEDLADAIPRVHDRPAPTRKVRRAERRVQRVTRRAERAQARLDARRTAPAPLGSRRRTGRRVLTVIFLLGNLAVAAYAVWYTSLRTEEPVAAQVSVEAVADVGRAIVVTDGVADLRTVVAGLEPELATLAAGVIELRVPVVVGSGGELDITNGEVRLRSDAEAAIGIVVDGGVLRITAATVTSWTGTAPDRESSRPRAFVDVTNGSVEIEQSRFVALGAAEGGQRGVTLGQGTAGRIRQSTFEDSYVGLELTGELDVVVEDVVVSRTALAGVRFATAQGVTIERTSVTESDGDGFAITGSSESISIIDSDAFGNGGSGFGLAGSAGDLLLAENRSFRNGRAGISLSNTRGVTLHRNSVWSNAGGVFFTGANAAAILDGNNITGNAGAGIELASAGSSVEVRENTIDHNDFGILVADGTLVLRDNLIVENGVGVAVLDTSPAVDISSNRINENYDVGIRLLQPDGLVVTSNELLANEHAAFQVAAPGQSADYQETNAVEAGRYGVERVFEGYGSADDLADLTPVPDFFFVEANRAFERPGS